MVGAGLNWLRIVGDLIHFLCLGLRSRTSLAAENLFLRKQLAFYEERKVKPRRADNPTRLSLVLLSRWFNWRDALTIVKPRTFITWHRKGFRLFWRWQSEPRPTANPSRTSTSDSQNGARESLLGPRADRKRAAAEARPSGVTANDPEVYVEVSAGDGYTSGRSAVGDFSKESRSGDHRM
jgi:hypothetical protein